MKNEAIAQIHAEHRALGAVVHGLLHFAHQANSTGAPPDFELLETMLGYIIEFPQKLHHVKEEDYIFAVLASSTPEARAVIDSLRAQHDDDLRLTAALQDALARFKAGAPDGAATFLAQVERFATLQWQHMTEEEDLLLPLAERHLDAAAWQRIGEAFGANGDPRFRGDARNRFDDMFRRIVNLAPAPIGLG